MRHIVICGLPRTTKFFHIISKRARFSEEKKVSEQKNVCFDSLYNFFILILISHSKKNGLDMITRLYNGRHVRHQSLLSDFNET